MKTTNRYSAPVCFLGAITMLANITAYTAPSDAATSMGTKSAMAASAKRLRTGPLDLKVAVGQKALKLALFADASFDVELEGSETIGSSVVYHGRVKGRPLSRVLIAQLGNHTAGSLFVPGKGAFAILSSGEAAFEISEIDPSKDPGCGVWKDDRKHRDKENKGKGVQEHEPAADLDESTSSIRSAQSLDSGPLPAATIDIAVGYSTQAVQDLWQGQQGMQNLIALAVGQVNDAFRNGLINARLRLIRIRQVDYPETGQYQTDIDNLASGSGPLGQFREIALAAGADLVSVILKTGAASAANRITTPGAQGRYSTVLRDWATSTLHFAHEVGHNLGCNHDPANSGGFGGYFSYSLGHNFVGNDGFPYGTIMSYPGIRIPYYSSPDVSYAGVPTGIAGARNNAGTIQYTAPNVIGHFNLPTELRNTRFADNGSKFLFDIDGNLSGTLRAAIESSDDLAHWSIRGFVTLTSGDGQFVDESVTGVPQRYYRLNDQADSSRNTVGFMRITTPPVPGGESVAISMIANHFTQADNTVQALLPDMPAGTIVQKFNSDAQTMYPDNIYQSGSGWTDPAMTFPSGEGLILRAPASLQLTFSGEVQDNVVNNSIPTGFSIRSSIVPQGGQPDSPWWRLNTGGLTFVRKMIDASGTYEKYYWDGDGGWDPFQPTFNVGESFWVYASSPLEWQQQFFLWSPTWNIVPAIFLSVGDNDNQPWLPPADLPLYGVAYDAFGSIDRVEIYLSGQSSPLTTITEPSHSFFWTWTGVPRGYYEFWARAYDNEGAYADSSVVATFVNHPPQVQISAPINGSSFTAPANVIITATASSEEGSIGKVIFYTDGQNIIGIDNTAPYSITWNNRQAGTYYIWAEAVDDLGQKGYSGTLFFTVKPGVTITADDPESLEPQYAMTYDGSFRVALTGTPLAYNLDVNYAVSGSSSATAGADYTALPGTIQIPAGSLWASIPIQVRDDPAYEGNETIVVKLSSHSSYNIATPNSATVTIVSLQDLGVLYGDSRSRAFGLSDSGRAAGASYSSYYNTPRAFRTAPYSPINSSTDNLNDILNAAFSAYGNSTAFDVANSNSFSQRVVGEWIYNSTARPFYHAQSYSTTETLLLPLPFGGSSGSARHINLLSSGENGGIAGYCKVGSYTNACYWAIYGIPASPSVYNFGQNWFPNQHSFGLGLWNNWMVGYKIDNYYGYHMAFLIDTFHAAPTILYGPNGEYQSEAYAVNPSAQVVGKYRSGYYTLPIKWQYNGSPGAYTAVALPLPPGQPHGSARAINASGKIVGHAWYYENYGYDHACLWDGGVLTDLTTILPPGSGWQLNVAHRINDRGIIVGEGTVGGQVRAFMLRP